MDNEALVNSTHTTALQILGSVKSDTRQQLIRRILEFDSKKFQSQTSCFKLSLCVLAAREIQSVKLTVNNFTEVTSKINSSEKFSESLDIWLCCLLNTRNVRYSAAGSKFRRQLTDIDADSETEIDYMKWFKWRHQAWTGHCAIVSWHRRPLRRTQAPPGPFEIF